jgi:hypothetical protein
VSECLQTTFLFREEKKKYQWACCYNATECSPTHYGRRARKVGGYVMIDIKTALVGVSNQLAIMNNSMAEIAQAIKENKK